MKDSLNCQCQQKQLTFETDFYYLFSATGFPDVYP